MPLTYTALATTTLSSNSTSIEFGSVSSAYTDLILVLSVKAVNAGANQWINLRLNGDTATNYSQVHLSTNGVTATSGRYSSRNDGIFIGDCNSNDYSILVCNLQNYASTSIRKTVICQSSDATSGDFLKLIVGCWRKTPEAITTINIQCESNAGNLASGTTATLYGILAA